MMLILISEEDRLKIGMGGSYLVLFHYIYGGLSESTKQPKTKILIGTKT